MTTTGEKPGKGAYKCNNCGTTVTLDDAMDTLPPCPKCKGTQFTRILGKNIGPGSSTDLCAAAVTLIK